MVEVRLKIKEQQANIRTIPYDSDRNAVELGASLENPPFELAKRIETPKYLFKKNNWTKFRREIGRHYRLHIYHYTVQTNKNLETEEIETYVLFK